MDRFEHLSDAQLEQYGTATTGSSGEAARTSGDVTGSFGNAEVDRHLEDCPECRTRLLQHLRLHFAPLAEPSVKTEPSAGCPSKETFQNLAAGLSVAPADPVQLIQHASQCDHCGPLLHELTDIFYDDLSPEDAALLAQLKTSSPAWQSATFAKMQAAAGVSESAIAASKSAAASAPGSRPRGTQDAETQRKRDAKGWIPSPAAATGASSASAGVSFFRFPRLQWVIMPTALAACAAIAFSIWWTQRGTPEKVEMLLAQAYTEQRTMEMRIPYAEHADFKQTRSGDTASLLSSPAALRKAADLIAANLKKNPDDPRWLMLSARLDLLDWRYKSAFSTLNKIDDEKVEDSPDFRLTRSLALYQKAEIEHDPQSYGQVVDLLGETLQKSPDDPVALFNQAVACEKLFMYECAVSDYDHFLKVDPNSGWASEAREHSNRIQEKKSLAP
jgi:tetratricopeptide (TPR) repeat protein